MDDERTLLDDVQDLGAWLVFLMIPDLLLAVTGRLLGWW